MIIARVITNREKFGFEMLKEIWANDIFVLNCCKCHQIRMDQARWDELQEKITIDFTNLKKKRENNEHTRE